MNEVSEASEEKAGRPTPAQIAEMLRDVATALELGGKGQERYRAAAYRKGAEAVELLAANLDRLIEEGRLIHAPGIGASLAAHIAEIRATGASSTLAKLTAALPEGAIALARLGLSLKAIETLSAKLGIRSVEGLREACGEGRVRRLPGFNEQRERKILATIERADHGGPDGGKGTILADALAAGRALAQELRALPDVRSAEIVGAARRGVEVVDEIEVLACTERPADVLDAFAALPSVAGVFTREGRAVTVRMLSGVVARVHAVPHGAHAAALQRLTGSAAHNAALDALAGARGLSIDEAGVRRGDARVDVADEPALYGLLGLSFVPAPLRDGGGEIAAAANGPTPRLLEVADVRGFVHCHTDHSDGRHTIEEMARAAEAFGMEYITITDHSPTASYARGLEADRLARQWDEIAAVQERVKIKILRGTESDILKDGALDHPDSVLEKLDVIIASVHSRYQLGPAETTARIVRAMKHPLFKIWGHALGRLLLKRPPVACDVDAILDAIAESRAAIELNGDPHRLDLAPDLARRARARGVKFVISVDAHATGELRNVDLGVLMAQRAGLGPADVLNTMDAAGFARAVRPLAS